MSIASPRPSINLPSSRRTSTSTITSTRSPSTSRPSSIRDTATSTTPTPISPQTRRRDRAALREFYNLQSSTSPDTPNKPPPTNPSSAPPNPQDHQTNTDPLSALDAPDFDATAYVSSLLETADTPLLLRTLTALASSRLGLQGDKKALVYDNYTTLLSATSTISEMRVGVDPSVQPATTALEPAVRHIVHVAVGIAETRRDRDGRRARDKEVVRWVIEAPERLRGLKEQGKDEEVDKEWKEVQKLLDSWEGVKGVDEVRRKCQDVVGEES